MEINIDQLEEMYPDFTDDQIQELYDRMHGDVPDKAPLSYPETAPMGAPIPPASDGITNESEPVNEMDLINPKSSQTPNGAANVPSVPSSLLQKPAPTQNSEPPTGVELPSGDQASNSNSVDAIIAKYGLDKFSPERRMELVQKIQAANRPPNIVAGLGALGAGLAGFNPIREGLHILDKQRGINESSLTEFDKGRDASLKNMGLQRGLGDELAEKDPNSPQSRVAQALAKQLGVNPAIASKLSAAQFKNFSPTFSKMYEQAQANYRAQLQANATKANKDASTTAGAKKEATLSDKQVAGSNDFDQAIAKAQDALMQLGDHSDWAGPIDASVPDDLIGPDQVAFRAKVGRMVDAYRKLVTGAGASNQELEKLEKRLPKVSDSWTNFRAKAQDYIQEVEKEKKIYLQNLKKQGKDTSAFDPRQMVKVSNGIDEYEIPQSDLPDAEQDGFHEVK